MNLIRNIMHGYLYLLYGFHKITCTGAFGHNSAVTIHETIQSADNALKAALVQHHVKQFHESSCSVASVVSSINAIRAAANEAIEPISQMEILEKVKTGHWKERMGPKGHNGKRGLPLPLLGKIVKSSLDAYEIRYNRIATVQATHKRGQVNDIKRILKQRLIDFEEKGKSLIIAHFDQGVYVRALNIPHISPVGGFDAQNDQVTILDVDPFQKNPYKITFDTFYKGLASYYHHVFKPFGYGSGGYVYIKLC